MLLDGFFVYIAEAMAKEKSFDVHITPHTNISVEDVFDDLAYEHYSLQESTAKPPLRIFEASSCPGRQPATSQRALYPEQALYYLTGATDLWKESADFRDRGAQ